jgi:hypothetical protein
MMFIGDTQRAIGEFAFRVKRVESLRVALDAMHDTIPAGMNLIRKLAS